MNPVATHIDPVEVARAQLLGTPCLQLNGISITTFRSSRIPALIGLLSSRRGPWPRDIVASLLWPNQMSFEGRHNLRQTILYVRQALGETAISGDRQTIELSPHIRTDVEILLDTSLNLLSPAEGRKWAEDAVQAYRGEFLPGAPDDWALSIRLQCARAHVSALLLLADHHMPERPERALSFIAKAIDAEPYLDGARVRKIKCLLLLGENSAAHREYESYKLLLSSELGIDPSDLVGEALRGSTTKKEPEAQPSKTALADDQTPIATLLGGSRPRQGLELAISYVPYWITKGIGSRGTSVIRQALDSRSGSFAKDLLQRGQVALAELLMASGQLFQAKEQLDDELLRTAPTETRVKALTLRAKICASVYQAAQAQEFIDPALELARASDLREALIDASRTGAEIAFELEDMSSAESLAKSCVNMSTSIGDWQSLATAVSLLALILNRSGRSDEAVVAAGAALNGLAGKDTARAAFTRVRVFRLMEEIGKKEEAEVGYRKGIEEARAYDDPLGLAVCLTYLGDLLTTSGHLDEALKLHCEALDIRRKLKEPLGEATSLRGIGRIYLAEGKLEVARDALRDSARIYLECDAVPGHASSLLALARVEMSAGHRPLAERIATRSRDLLSGMSRLSRLTIGPAGDSLLAEAEDLLRSLSDSK